MKLLRSTALLAAGCAVLAACGVHVPAPATSTATTVAPGNPPPKKRHTGPGTVSGKVLENGKPVAGASVQVVVWPKGAVSQKLRVGQRVPTKRLGRDSAADDGTYAVKLARIGGKYREGHSVNVAVDVVARAGATEWDVSLHLLAHGKHKGRTKPLHLSFDLGRRTVTVGGHKSHLRVVH